MTTKGRAKGGAVEAAASSRSTSARRGARDVDAKILRGVGGSRAAVALSPERGSGDVGAESAGRWAIETLTPEESRALISATSSRGHAGVRDRALVTVLYRGMLRIAEALALRPKDVNLDTGDVVVLHGKGDKRRVVRLSSGALAVVERWLRRREKLGLNGRHPLFCTISAGVTLRRGQPLDQSQVRHLLRRLAQKAGIEKRVHPHGLRHTGASELAREGVRVPAIQAMLGHASLMTTQRYVRALQPEEYLEEMGAREWKL